MEAFDKWMGARSLLDTVSEKLGKAVAAWQVAVSIDKCPGARKNDNLRRIDREGDMANLSDVINGAMSLGIRDRAVLAEKLLASLEELSEDEAERLWADESQRRLDQYRAGKAQAVSVDDVHAKVNRLLR